MFCLPRIIHSPLSNPSYSFRPTAAFPLGHCCIHPLSSAAVHPCSHCPQVSIPPALFFHELAPSPTLCIFSPSSGRRRLRSSMLVQDPTKGTNVDDIFYQARQSTVDPPSENTSRFIKNVSK